MFAAPGSESMARDLLTATVLTLGIVLFNPQVAGLLRQAELLTWWSGQDVVGLVGTKQRNTEREATYTTRWEGNFCVYEMGWMKKAESHAGLAIALSKRVLDAGRVTDIIAPRGELAGRIAAIRIKGPRMDALFIALYPPPFSNARNRRMYSKVMAKLNDILMSTANRTCPIIMTDANARLGIRKDATGQWAEDPAEGIGRFAAEHENESGRLFREVVVRHGMALANSLVPSGATYYHTNCPAGTRIDYIALPCSAVCAGRLKWCGVLYDELHCGESACCA
eukprot:TRINITY_DN36433_c0_g1_i4.p1 TRINITY_DN36433_c0_g1~~TRINITY_DN36433_c0_g1_i4.p1  ORF type:complete len:281 (-),score=48.70 TRINITY_DN36433_c0_g1_i4:76-918(-)